MGRRAIRGWFFPLGLVCLLALTGTKARAAPPQRIHGNIRGRDVYALPGNVHRIPVAARDIGPVDPFLVLPRVTIHLSMTSAQQADLTALLQAQQTRGSSQYHKWLTPEQFGTRFGSNQNDIQKITRWLENQGFWNVEVARSRNAISFSGSAQQVEAVFRTALHRFNVDGKLHYANVTAPMLPSELKGMVLAIRGLNDFRPKSRLIRRRALRPNAASGNAVNAFLTPANIAAIYDLNPIYNSGLDGTGWTIGVPGQSDVQLSDMEAFRSAAGLPSNDPQITLDGDDPGINSGDETESDLDLEWAGGIAKNAHIVFVNSQDVFTSVKYLIDNNLADVVLITYAVCESPGDSAAANSISGLFQQANAQGITIVASSGDAGAASCDDTNDAPPAAASQGLAVDFPASSPYVTAVGGTEFNEGTGIYWQQSSTNIISLALSYIPEMAWNDTYQNPSQPAIWATGGGASTLFSKPTWQAGAGMPNDGWRDVPDVAFSASQFHDPYLVCSEGDCVSGFIDNRKVPETVEVVGGTSAAVPVMAGIVALLDQQANERQGNINPNLYTLASVSTDVFHDVVQGNNMVPCQQGTPDCPSSGQMGFSAGPGYDQVTGLGSIDAYNLFREWNADFQIAIAPTDLRINPGGSGAAMVTVTPSAGFAGTVSFACSVSSGLANMTCSIPGTVPGSGSATLAISSASTANGPGSSGEPWGPIAGAATGCAVIFALFWSRRRARLAAAAIGIFALAAVSCGGGGSSTSSMGIQSVAESGIVTVTATSGLLSHTATLSVTVQ